MMRVLGNLFAMAAGLLIALLIADGVLRLLGVGPVEIRQDSLLGYRYVPGVQFRKFDEGASTGRINSQGWRDVEHAFAKPAGRTRVLILGDSFVAAFQVPLDSTFFRKLERSLDRRAGAPEKVEVVALGQNGNGTAAECLTYERFGRRYDPDIVALLFILNDQADNWKPVALEKSRPFFVAVGDSMVLDTSFAETAAFRHGEHWMWLRTHSVLWAQMHRALATLRARARPPVQPGGVVEQGYYTTWNFDARVPADTIAAFRLTEKILAKLAGEVQRDGRRFVVFAAGFAQQEDHALLAEYGKDPAFDPDKTQRWLLSIGARHGFDVIPLTPAFRAASVALDQPFWFGKNGLYGHWNSAGHTVAANVMEDYLARAIPGLDTTALAPLPKGPAPSAPEAVRRDHGGR